MDRWTERQLARTLRWIEDDLDRPSKNNQYQMQTALEARRVFRAVLHDAKAKDELEHFRLKFSKGQEESAVSEPAPYHMSKDETERLLVEARAKAMSMSADGRMGRGRQLSPKERHKEMLKARNVQSSKENKRT